MIDREIYKRAYKLLEELEADPVSVLKKAKAIYKMAMEGVHTETISPANGEIVGLLAQQPGIAVQALQITNATVKRIHEELANDEALSTDGNTDTGLVINLSKLIVEHNED